MWMDCSEICVTAYMDRYGLYCTGGRTPTCKDYSMIHNGGPNGCNMGLEDYWSKVAECCGLRNLLRLSETADHHRDTRAVLHLVILENNGSVKVLSGVSFFKRFICKRLLQLITSPIYRQWQLLWS